MSWAPATACLIWLAALLAPANAGALTVADTQLQRWADRSHLPTVDESVQVLLEVCPTAEASACTWPGGPIYLAAGPERRTRWLHELGHRFDYAAMDDGERARFMAIYGETRAWRCGCANSPHELFATAYAQLARTRRPDPGPWWEPMRTILEHRTEVRSLLRGAARGG
jgi:hypothetical protein